MMMPSDFRGGYSMRPTSEILKSRRSVLSEQTEQLNNWYEDLQKYEKSLEDIATATLDQSFKEELQHVDQWFCYLSDAERTATIYTLLQHNSSVQTRFFMNILQQQKRDSILTLSEHDSSPFHQAEKEVSQRLMNIMPYKTGQPKATLSSGNLAMKTRQPTSFDRHSIAIGETDDYLNDKNRVFPSPGLYSNPLGSSSQLSIGSSRPTTTTSAAASSTLNNNNNNDDDNNNGNNNNNSNNITASGLASPRTATFQKNRSRPSSGIDIDHSPDFFSAWRSHQTSVVNNNNNNNNRHSFIERPKSADIFGDHYENNSSSSIQFQPFGLSSSTLSLSDIANIVPPPSTSAALSVSSSTNQIPFIDKPLPRITTVNERDEENHDFISPYPTTSTNNLTPGSAFTQYYSASRSSSPVPSTSTPTSNHYGRPTLSPSNSSTTISNNKENHHPHQHYHNNDNNNNYNNNNRTFGTYLDPKDANSKYHQPRNQNKTKNNNNNGNIDNVIDMDLLKDVPSWFRSLRLHKYNSIFETMCWQDIIKLTDEELQTKGVAALGARRKMLKVFESVEQHCKQNNIPY
ncbi:unnamed protein product [Cunninghamella blakesleeana]